MGTDEISLKGVGKNLYCITDPDHRMIMQPEPRFNHTSVMFAHFMGGYALPPFIIMKGLTKEPPEISILKITMMFL